MAMIAIDGARLSYREAGAGEPLVFVHGTGFTGAVWDGVADDLADSYRTIAYDRRGYGHSTGAAVSRAGYNAAHGDDLANLLMALGAAPATVVAWSSGGFYALHAAMRHPGRIARLILYEPPFHSGRSLSLPMMGTFLKLTVLRAVKRPKAAADIFLRFVLSYSDGTSSFDDLPTSIRADLAANTGALHAELAAGTGEELTAGDLRSHVTVPLALMVGERSHAFFGESAGRLRAIFPDAVPVTIAGGNHLAHIDRPRQFVAAVREARARL